MANNKTLKGLFIKKMLDKLGNKELNEEDKQIIEKAHLRAIIDYLVFTYSFNGLMQ